jgi:Xaa-Pro aminopeptidase
MKSREHAEFKRRRTRLMEMMAPGSIAILASGQQTVRNRYVTYPFRQDSDFYYLTGFDLPDAYLVLIPDRAAAQTVFFCNEQDAKDRMWHGIHIGPDEAITALGVDDAFPLEDIDDILPGLIEDKARIYASVGHHDAADRKLMRWLEGIDDTDVEIERSRHRLSDLSYLLHELRLVKSAYEQQLIRTASHISARAHNRAMRWVKPGSWEYQLDAEIQHEFAMAGARRAAYISIVASGKNNCVLHYTDNNSQCHSGDLVLVDAGCEFQHYASDISRTYPISGTFTPAQRAIYQLVLTAQAAAIAAIQPGVRFSDGHDAAYAVFAAGLQQLGITQSIDDDIGNWFMHRTCHWLGLDVHDVGEYRIDTQSRMLEPGMVMAVEPGLYFQPDDLSIAPKWRGIGVRIEDVVLVTKTGHEVLSADAIKDPDAIEHWMNKQPNRLI